MATPEEIERRVEEKDASRTARRSAAARRISELAQHRAAITEQLNDIERQLGEVLADARDVIDMDELAQFTDVPVADLTRWLEARTLTRARRKKSTGASGAKSAVSCGTTAATTPVGTPTASQVSTPSEPSTATAPARVVAKVT